MGFDFGYLIGGGVIFYIAAKMYKKSTGRPISELWKGTKDKLGDVSSNAGYRKVYITKGIKS